MIVDASAAGLAYAPPGDDLMKQPPPKSAGVFTKETVAVCCYPIWPCSNAYVDIRICLCMGLLQEGCAWAHLPLLHTPFMEDNSERIATVNSLTVKLFIAHVQQLMPLLRSLWYWTRSIVAAHEASYGSSNVTLRFQWWWFVLSLPLQQSLCLFISQWLTIAFSIILVCGFALNWIFLIPCSNWCRMGHCSWSSVFLCIAHANLQTSQEEIVANSCV